jgi:hypothetical protein
MVTEDQTAQLAEIISASLVLVYQILENGQGSQVRNDRQELRGDQRHPGRLTART